MVQDLFIFVGVTHTRLQLFVVERHVKYRPMDASVNVGRMDSTADELNMAKELTVYDARPAKQMGMTAVLVDL